tara:strand:- start:163 stop:1536 length:1374 start_codon:yes stop_codon:yes gene_type:complete
MVRCEICSTWLGLKSTDRYCADDINFLSRIESGVKKNDFTIFLESLGLNQYEVTTNPEIIRRIGDGVRIDSKLAVEVFHHYLAKEQSKYNIFDIISLIDFDEKPLIDFYKDNLKMFYFENLMTLHIQGRDISDFTEEMVLIFRDKVTKSEFFEKEIGVVLTGLHVMVYNKILPVEILPSIYLLIFDSNFSSWQEIALDKLFSSFINKETKNEREKILKSIFSDKKHIHFQDTLVLCITNMVKMRPSSTKVNPIPIKRYTIHRLFLSKKVTQVCEKEFHISSNVDRKEFLINVLTCFGADFDTSIVYNFFKQYPSNISSIENLITVDPEKYIQEILKEHLKSKSSEFRRKLQFSFSKCNHQKILDYLEIAISDYCKIAHTDLKYLLEYYIGVCNIRPETSDIEFLQNCKKLTSNNFTHKLIEKAINYLSQNQYKPADFLIEPDHGASGWGSVQDPWRG